MDWHVAVSGAPNAAPSGPISDEEIFQRARDGRLRGHDLVWHAGMDRWRLASQVPELRAAAPAIGVATQEIGQDRMMRALLPVGRSGWAIAAGYLGLFSLLLAPAPFAIVTGLLAIRAIRRDPKKHGLGRAVFGIVLGTIGTLLLVILAWGAWTSR